MGLRVILVPVGSAGDIHPFVAIGLRLKARGHRVVIVASSYYRTLFDTAGLDWIETIDAQAQATAIDHPDFWHPTRGLRPLSEGLIVPALRPQLAAIEAHFEPSRTVVVASTLAFGSRLAYEKLRVPTVSVHLSPAAIRSLDQTPAIPNLPSFPNMPKVFKRMVYWYGDRFAADPAMCPGLNRVCSDLGLAPVRRPMHQWLHSPDRVIGLFPSWFATPAPDWPSQVRLTGFALYDEADVRATPPDLTPFLEEGEPPVVFTAGTAMNHGTSFFQSAVEACSILGVRGILLTQCAKQLPTELPASVRHFPYIPFSQLLPRASALVHHGGIGTTAQAIRAAVPQVVVPMAYDQFDNSARLERMGVAASLPWNRINGASLASTLRRLLARAELPSRLSTAARRFETDRSLDETCHLIEETA